MKVAQFALILFALLIFNQNWAMAHATVQADSTRAQKIKTFFEEHSAKIGFGVGTLIAGLAEWNRRDYYAQEQVADPKYRAQIRLWLDQWQPQFNLIYSDQDVADLNPASRSAYKSWAQRFLAHEINPQLGPLVLNPNEPLVPDAQSPLLDGEVAMVTELNSALHSLYPDNNRPIYTLWQQIPDRLKGTFVSLADDQIRTENSLKNMQKLYGHVLKAGVVIAGISVINGIAKWAVKKKAKAKKIEMRV